MLPLNNELLFISDAALTLAVSSAKASQKAL